MNAAQTATMPHSNGIPLLGLGTYPLQGDEAVRAITAALELGIRHIDTAQMYGNEADVGRAIRQSGIARHEVYIVTKVDPSNLGAGNFRSSVEKSMQHLGGPADLLLIHWPPEDRELDATLDRLVAEHQRGMAHAIGVSNFTPRMLRQAHARTKGLIINNQVEFHPLLDQRELLQTASELGITLSAYSPLARGAAMKPQAVQAIAERLNRPASEIVLRWIIQQGVAAIPMTTKRENALSNLNALQFELSAEDMSAISAIGTRQGRTIDPGWMKGRWDS